MENGPSLFVPKSATEIEKEKKKLFFDCLFPDSHFRIGNKMNGRYRPTLSVLLIFPHHSTVRLRLQASAAFRERRGEEGLTVYLQLLIAGNEMPYSADQNMMHRLPSAKCKTPPNLHFPFGLLRDPCPKLSPLLPFDLVKFIKHCIHVFKASHLGDTDRVHTVHSTLISSIRFI